VSAPHTDVEQVELANTAFYEALERGDFETVSRLWLTPSDLGVDETYHDPADTGVISCVHPGWPVLTGRGEVLRSYALIMATPTTSSSSSPTCMSPSPATPPW